MDLAGSRIDEMAIKSAEWEKCKLKCWVAKER